MQDETRYTVTILRAGQPRPYADSEYEYLIKVERMGSYGPDKGKLKPWLMHGDIEARIRQDEADRESGKLIGGWSPEELRKQQREWARKIVTALCHKHREKGDQDGPTGIEADFYPTLKRLDVNPAAGTIRALIVELYTD